MSKSRMLHPKSVIERLTLPRYKGGRGIVNLNSLRNRQVTNIRKLFQRMKEKTTLHKAVVAADRGITTVLLHEEEHSKEGELNRAD